MSENPEFDLDLEYGNISNEHFKYEGQIQDGKPFGVGRLLHLSSGNIYEG